MEILTSVIINYVVSHPMTLVYWALATFLFWFLYATLMRLCDRRAKYQKYSRQWWACTVAGSVLLVIGYPYDVLYNLTYGNLIFWQLPRKSNGRFEWTFTARLQRLIFNTGWRGVEARFICRYLVEPFDPDHCGMGKLKQIYNR